ncbi:LacI family transcriptional regulator [Paenibacillus taihuensis]|uniref:LacI family transcriptional regulator n=1 Tax=Paenibacillus taihuensis TaxID=1156355 RepID=A0A3D9SE56_9BACL|nr:LacI family DNA-binding transcriptional regulator [Paenibacillus taihuensis]REE93139.1 LacI family transcriptional regulator [Paenibacillus taihuensis]
MATIKDIAKIAGVSTTTVSRALNGYDDVSKETKEKIKTIADELDYWPNAVARSLVSSKTNTIGVIFSELKYTGGKDTLAFDILIGINERANEMNYDILLFSTSPSKQRIKSYYNLCQERNVDGAIIFGLRVDDPYLEEVIEKSKFPCVLIDIPFSNEHLGNVTTDNVEGVRKAVQHLIDWGHTHIAMINGYPAAHVSEQRLKGFKKALAENGIAYDESKIWDGEFSEDGGERAMLRILEEHPGVTAVFCSSDLMALGAMRALEKRGRKVPDSVSVIGYDDIILSSYCVPKLTTIHQNKYDMGWAAAKLLIEMLEGKEINHNVVLDNELIIRESTKSLK